MSEESAHLKYSKNTYLLNLIHLKLYRRLRFLVFGLEYHFLRHCSMLKNCEERKLDNYHNSKFIKETKLV